MLDARTAGGRDIVERRAGDAARTLELRRSDAANGVILAGAPTDVAAVRALITAADMAAHQHASRVRAPAPWTGGSRLSLSSALTLLDLNGTATCRDAHPDARQPPRLDPGRHALHPRDARQRDREPVSRTYSMEAGLRLPVLPSPGEREYLTLDLRAELTSLSDDISGSPVKDGQVVGSTVMAEDGDFVLLGGFTRTASEVRHRASRRLLGSVLPFLASRDIVKHTQQQTFLMVTAHVVDLAGGLAPHAGRGRGALTRPAPLRRTPCNSR